ncbi:MAG TPA: hypothetical protein VGK87_01210 [Anaerolineae bacterium]
MNRKQRSPTETLALKAARRRSLIFLTAALALSVLMLALSSEFLALQCVVLAALTLGTGISCASAANDIDAKAAAPAAARAGVLAAMAYVMPLILVVFYRFVTLDAAGAARLAGQLSAAQATSLIQANITPGLEYFRGQYVSYIFGYFLFGLLFGWGFGAFGRILARRLQS